MPRVAGKVQREVLEAQRKLDELCETIYDRFEELPDRMLATSEWLREVVADYHDPQPKDTRSDFFDAFDRFVAVKRYSICRHKSYLGLRRILLRFEAYCGEELRFSTFDHLLLGRLDTFIRNEHDYYDDPRYLEIYADVPEVRRPSVRAQNTINGLHTRLRTFICWANEQGLTSINGYHRFKVQGDVYGSPIVMRLEERKHLYAAPMPSERLAVQRDIFIFQCLVGCRVSDLQRFTRHNIVEGGLEYVARKTKDGNPITVRVPLTDTAKEIIERYKGGDRLLPFVSDAVYNRALKEVFKAAGLDRPTTYLDPKTRTAKVKPLWELASSHLARRTFAGLLYPKVKDPNVIASMTGHKEGSRAFARYRTIDDEVKAEAVKMLD